MAIFVVCPGCRKRFQVDDKFAGKTGPCPKCKTPIRVPTKSEEVKIHGAEGFESGGRGTAGQLLTKPIAFEETKWNPTVAAAIGGAVVTVVLVAWFAGRAGLFESFWARGLGLLVVSPPLVIAGYGFLRESEDLEPYRGKELYLRSAICALVYVILWWVFVPVKGQFLSEEFVTWLLVAPPFFVVGATAAWLSLDLDFGSGFFHYCFYLLVTVLLQRIAGMDWVWTVPRETLPGVV